MTLQILIQIVFICSFDIDPRFDKNHCAKYLTECVNIIGDLNECSDFYEVKR